MASATVLNAYSVRNAGDAAIMLATSKLLRNLGYESVNVSSRHWEEDRAFYEEYGIGSIPPIVDFPTRGSSRAVKRLARFVFSAFIGSFIAFMLGLSRGNLGRGFAKRLSIGLYVAATSDVLVFAGGGYLYSAKRRVNVTLLHVIAQILIAKLLRKPILMMPQSVGPLNRPEDRFLVRWALRRVSPVVVRDEESVRTCIDELERQQGEIELLPDIVFYGIPGLAEVAQVEMRQNNSDILLVAMDWTWARAGDSFALDRYVGKLAAVAESLANKGYRVTLAGNSRIPEQDQDDFAVAAAVLQRIQPPCKGVTIMPPDTDLQSLTEAMTNARLVIGTRLHSCILSLVSGTPTIALAYQPKTTGTFKLLELGPYAHDVEAFDPEALVEQAVAMLDDETTVRLEVAAAVSWAQRAIQDHFLAADDNRVDEDFSFEGSSLASGKRS